MRNGDAVRRLGAYLSGDDARRIADSLDDGDTLTVALGEVSASRRPEVERLLGDAGLGVTDRARTVEALRAIEGARSALRRVRPMWTMPGHVAQSGALTADAARLVEGARESVVCSTYNFQRTSAMWSALATAAGRPEISVRVYMDTEAADRHPSKTTASTDDTAAHLRPGTVLRTTTYEGRQVRSHAKFLSIDHRHLLVTSANFSWSAEQANLEFGVLVEDPNLVERIELEMFNAEGALYERVAVADPS